MGVTIKCKKTGREMEWSKNKESMFDKTFEILRRNI